MSYRTNLTIVVSALAFTCAACDSGAAAPAADAQVADAQVADAPATDAFVPTDAPAATDTNTWSIDGDVRTGLFPSTNCMLSGPYLGLSEAEAGGGLGSINLLIFGVPTANATLTVVPPATPPAAGQIIITIGRDRESANQFQGQSGTAMVSVVTTDPQQIRVQFAGVPGMTMSGMSGVLAGDVSARGGSFIGACDFTTLH